jgi:capsular polysaccharide transport system ATP-binding protein
MIDFFGVSDEAQLFGQSVQVLDHQDFHLPPGRYALLSPVPEYKRLVIDLLAGIRPPKQGQVAIQGSISWPLGRGSVMRGQVNGLDVVTMIADLYGVDADQTGDFVSLLISRPDFMDTPIDSWPPYVRQEFNFALGLVPDFDIYIIDAPIPFEQTRFTRMWKVLFEDRLVGKTLILSSYRPKNLLDYCDKGLVYHEGRLIIEDDLEECIERYPARQAREELGFANNADSSKYTELDF